jgi:hypothetical protein
MASAGPARGKPRAPARPGVSHDHTDATGAAHARVPHQCKRNASAMQSECKQ